MTVMGIMLFFGLLGTFLGIALLTNERKERKAFQAKEREEQAAQASTDEEGELHLIKEGEEKPFVSSYKPNINRLKLGFLFACQGSLGDIAAIGLFFINGYVVKIAWYITLPVAIAYFGICLLMDALLMAPKGDQASQESNEETPLAKGEQAQPEDVEGIAALESSKEASRHPELVEGSQPLDSQSESEDKDE